MFTEDKNIKVLQKINTNHNELCLSKRTKSKWFSYHISSLLYFQNGNSPLRKSYLNSMYCANSIVQQENKLTSHYCKNRWCITCNRIRTAVLINTYMPRLKECRELWFLTLTRPNVSAKHLSRELRDLQKIIRHIMTARPFRKYKAAGGIGIRKTECTYNPQADTYHPHFHIIIDSEEMARYILDRWLALSPRADAKAQDLRRVEDVGDGCLEIFKYFTKLLAKGKDGRRFFDAVHMNTIFEAMAGKRVFQRFGKKDAWRCAEVDEDAIEEAAVLEGVGKDGDVWRWLESEDYTGYYNDVDGTALVEIERPKKLSEMFDQAEKECGVLPVRMREGERDRVERVREAQKEKDEPMWDPGAGFENSTGEEFEKDSAAPPPPPPPPPPEPTLFDT